MKLLIVIVLYEVLIEKSIAFQSLYRNKFIKDSIFDWKILLYDNSKRKSDYKFTECDRIVDYIFDANNSGVSKAYNIAAKYAEVNGYDWLMIADQDTYFPENILNSYYEAFKYNPGIKLFLPKVRIAPNGKYMSPVKNKHFFTKLSDSVPSGFINLSDYGIINSGILVNVHSFWNVGGYNERVWLDFSDFQFIERFSQKYDTAYIINEECIQAYSDITPDINKKNNRFKLFCNSVKYYQSTKLINKFWIFCSVLRRTLSLCKQSRNFKPLSIFFRYYL